MKTNYKKYLVALGSIHLIAFFTILPLAIYLINIGEYLSLEEIRDKQLSSDSGNSVYGSALHDTTRDYKMYMFNKLKPEIIALGSSRVMQFSNYMFTKEFYNLGGAMNSLREGEELIDQINIVKPKLLILGIDIWWFNENYQPSYNVMPVSIAPPDPNKRPEFTLGSIKSLAGFILKDKIAISEIFNLFGDQQHIGISGNKGDGFGHDGFYHYTRHITGKIEPDDLNFNNTINRIRTGTARFEYSSEVSNNHFNNFVRLINNFSANGTQVVLFFPPFAREINQEMRELSEKYSYVEELKHRLLETGVFFYDFTDDSETGFDSCEFIDGFHGGEITYMRILRKIANLDPSTQPYINLNLISKLINQHEGLASLPSKIVFGGHEVDFLELGCSKANSS